MKARFVWLLLAAVAPAWGGLPAQVLPERLSAAQVLVPATIPLAASVNAIYRLESAPH